MYPPCAGCVGVPVVVVVVAALDVVVSVAVTTTVGTPCIMVADALDAVEFPSSGMTVAHSAVRRHCIR